VLSIEARAVPSTNTTTSEGMPWTSHGFTAPRLAAIPDTAARREALKLGDKPARVAACHSFDPRLVCHKHPPLAR